MTCMESLWQVSTRSSSNTSRERDTDCIRRCWRGNGSPNRSRSRTLSLLRCSRHMQVNFSSTLRYESETHRDHAPVDKGDPETCKGSSTGQGASDNEQMQQDQFVNQKIKGYEHRGQLHIATDCRQVQF